MIPTYLYIKRHKLTGKCYFGKTTKSDPINYSGSGKYWIRHLRVHGYNHVETLWYKLFTDQEELTRVALEFSRQQDIVNSDLWLNLREENGLDGSVEGTRFSEESKKKISDSAKEYAASLSPEDRKKRFGTMAGRTQNPESNKKRSESMKISLAAKKSNKVK